MTSKHDRADRELAPPGGDVHAQYARARERVGKLPLSTKIYQGIGALPDTYKTFAFNTFLLFYYSQVLGVPASLASIAIMLALVIDAVIDPIVGSYSDGLKTRLGRRHPLMYAAAVPLGICMYLVFAPPEGLGHMALLTWLLVFAVGTRVAMAFFLIPWNALFAEFTDDYAERSAIITFRFLCGWLGGVVFVWCTWTFIFPSTPEYTPGQLNPHGYETFGIIVAMLMAAAVLFTTHFTRREVPYLLQPVHTTRFGLGHVVQDVLLALRNRDYLVLFTALLIASAITGTLAALELYMNTYFWELRPEELRWFTLTLIGSVTAFVLIPWLQSRFDKKQMLVTGLFFLLFNGILLISLRFLDVLPENGDPLLLKVLVANEIVRIMVATVVLIMLTSMIADSLDAQELQTGRRQEGVFSAALAFSTKATTGLGVVLGGLVLDLVLEFPRGAAPGSLTEDLVVRLGAVVGIAIPLLYVLPFWMATRYRITREVHGDIHRALVERRARAAAQAQRANGG